MKALLRSTTLVGLLALSFAVTAQQPAPGLGQAWPNIPDVSKSPHWHVYVFQLNGIKYIEIADLSGRIVSAVGTANNQFIALPVGTYSQYVSIPNQTAPLPQGVVALTPTTVYQDSATNITVANTSNGAVATAAAGCTNPVECNTNINQQ